MSLIACWNEGSKVYHEPKREDEDGWIASRCGLRCDQTNDPEVATHEYIPLALMGCKKCYPLGDVFRRFTALAVRP